MALHLQEGEISMQFGGKQFTNQKQALAPMRHIFLRVLFIGAIGVLLGRASIGHAVAPFGLAYFVVVTEVIGTRRSWPAWCVVLGPLSLGSVTGTSLVLLEMILYRICRKVFFRTKSPDLHVVPFIAGIIDIASRLAVTGTVWTKYDILMSLAEGGLVIIVSLIFLQALPILFGKNTNKDLKGDHIVSIAILIGTIISGLSGVAYGEVSGMRVAIDWVVMLMASVGGIGVGTTVAIVLGTLSLLSRAETLAEVAVLGFAALLAGVLKEAGRLWIALAFVACEAILTMTNKPDWTAVQPSVYDALVAAGIFLMTSGRLRSKLAAYVPGTAEHKMSEQARVRRVQQLLSEKMTELSQVFDELAVTFADAGDNPLKSARQLVDHAVSSAANKVCHGCPRRLKCWEQEGLATYQSIVHTVAKLEGSPPHVRVGPTEDLRDRCIRIDSMMGVLRQNLDIIDRDARWLSKLHEQRALVSAQLGGIANVIRAVAGQLEKENESSLAGEEQIVEALEQLGLYVDHVHIVSLDPGKVEVEITQPSQGAYENSVRVIAPLLSGIVGENITVKQVTGESTGPFQSVFSSERVYDVKTGVASVARDGRMVSGDTHTCMDIGNGRYAVAVSDGMGNGERARRESSAAIELLRKLLKAGFDEQLAIKTVNSTLLLRSREEIFTTLDMVLIDLYSARAEFLKIGSAPSFIKRGNSVKTITGANVPIGILRDIEVQSVDEQLCEGDLLIIVSDGVYDAVNVYDREDWLKRQIENLETDDPQAVADTLLESAIRANFGEIRDDMTVMVAAISKHQPEWAAIKVPGVVGLRRDKEKSRRGA
jgi:stage II sporulation protein E